MSDDNEVSPRRESFLEDDGAVEFSDDDEVITFEEDDGEPSEMDHDPMDDPQECCGAKLSCSKRAVRKVMGLTLVAIAAFMFSLVTLGVKTSLIGGMEFCGVLFFRGGVSWFINFGVMIIRRIPVSRMLATKEKVPLLLILGFFGAFSQLFAFYSVSVLSMADANVYMMTSPVFVFILARIWLGDPVDYVDVIAAAVCIIGVIFVSKPSAIFGCTSTDSCGLTQYCADGSCVDCGSDIDGNPLLLETMTVENYTAYEICRGVQQITDTTLVELPDESVTTVGPTYCDMSWGNMVAVAKEPETENNCHYTCQHELDCGFFTSGFVGASTMQCILYVRVCVFRVCCLRFRLLLFCLRCVGFVGP